MNEIVSNTIQSLKTSKYLTPVLVLLLPGGLFIFGLLFFRRWSAIRFSKLWLGESEKPGNSGFVNPMFEEKMREIGGFSTYDQWCAEFVRFVILSKTRPKYNDYVNKLLSRNTHVSWANAQKDPTGLSSTHQTPRNGDIVIWSQRGGSGGHTGIVVKTNKDGSFETVEGNVNYFDGATYDGIVAHKTHTMSGYGSMYVEGFIRLKQRIFKIF